MQICGIQGQRVGLQATAAAADAVGGGGSMDARATICKLLWQSATHQGNCRRGAGVLLVGTALTLSRCVAPQVKWARLCDGRWEETVSCRSRRVQTCSFPTEMLSVLRPVLRLQS